MNTDRGSSRTARAYARELERSLERLAGRPVVFSHRDWDLARRWHDSGVPLGLVVELLEERGSRVTRGLRSIAAAVESAWEVVRAGETRSGPGAGNAPAEATTPSGDPYAEAAARTDVEALERVLRAASERLRAGQEHPTIDGVLDDVLADACPAAWVEDAAREVAGRLAPYRGRLPPAELERVRRRAVVDNLRARLGLPGTTRTRRHDPIG